MIQLMEFWQHVKAYPKIFQIPHGSAVYFLIKNGVVLYIGQSPNVFSRLSLHPLCNYDSVGLLPAPEDDLLKLEAYWIAALQPELNQRGKDVSPITTLEKAEVPSPRVIRKEWPRIRWVVARGNYRLIVDSRRMVNGRCLGSRDFVKTTQEALALAESIAAK
jgi:hypothetical protein